MFLRFAVTVCRPVAHVRRGAAYGQSEACVQLHGAGIALNQEVLHCVVVAAGGRVAAADVLRIRAEGQLVEEIRGTFAVEHQTTRVWIGLTGFQCQAVAAIGAILPCQSHGVRHDLVRSPVGNGRADHVVAFAGIHAVIQGHVGLAGPHADAGIGSDDLAEILSAGETRLERDVEALLLELCFRLVLVHSGDFDGYAVTCDPDSDMDAVVGVAHRLTVRGHGDGDFAGMLRDDFVLDDFDAHFQ